jgi:hypothetical protein
MYDIDGNGTIDQTEMQRQALRDSVKRLVCQQWPLVGSLGLNNPPRIGYTLVKSRIKNIRCREQGDYRCKMAAAGFLSFLENRARLPRFATTGITPWQTALNCTADCHNKNNPLAICSKIRGTQLSAVCHTRVKSSTSHFTSNVPLFAAPYRIF